MPVYPGRRKGTHRVTVWAGEKQHEEIVEGSRADALEHEARMRIALGVRTRLKQRTAPVFSVFSVEDYAPHARAHLGGDTWHRSRRYFVKRLRGHFGPYRLDEITGVVVDGFVRARLAAKLKPSSINTELRVLVTMLRFARIDMGYPMPELRVRYLKPPQRRVRAWTPAEVERLFASAAKRDRELVPLLAFLLNTGCRKGEAMAALWDWIDWPRRSLRIDCYEGWAPKSRRPREVPLSAALEAVLRSMPMPSDWIFPNDDESRRVTFPDRRFTEVRDAAGLKGGPHTCRHTFASMFLAAGGSLFELSALLGHTASRTTELYAHLLPGHLERARGRVNLDARGRNPGVALAKKAAS
jgi:integrase